MVLTAMYSNYVAGGAPFWCCRPNVWNTLQNYLIWHFLAYLKELLVCSMLAQKAPTLQCTRNFLFFMVHNLSCTAYYNCILTAVVCTLVC